eukprot:g14225.t1
MQGDTTPDATQMQDAAKEVADPVLQEETNATTSEHVQSTSEHVQSTSEHVQSNPEHVQSNSPVDQPQTDGDAVPNNFQGLAMPRHVDPAWIIHVPSVRKTRKNYSKKTTNNGTEDDGNDTATQLSMPASNAVIDGAKDSTNDSSSNVATTVANTEATDATISDIPVGKEVEAIEEVSANPENTVEAVPVITEKQTLPPEGAATVVGTAKCSALVPKKKPNKRAARTSQKPLPPLTCSMRFTDPNSPCVYPKRNEKGSIRYFKKICKTHGGLRQFYHYCDFEDCMGPAIVGNFCYKHRGGKLNPKVVLRPTNGTYLCMGFIHIFILTFLTQFLYKQPEHSNYSHP